MVWWRRVPRAARAAAVVLFAGTGAALVAWRWTSAPSAVDPHRITAADAIVVFVGGRGERLDTAEELVEAGVAEAIVIPNGTNRAGPAGRAYCLEGPGGGIDVRCPNVPVVDTRDEARLFAALARDEGWEHLVVVTSTYHVERARIRLERCFDGTVTTVAAPVSLGFFERISKLSHEVAGHLEAQVFQRGC